MKKTSPIVIGIDSSTTCTGYAVMKKEKDVYKLINYGKIIPPEDLTYLKICEYIYTQLEKVISEYSTRKAEVVVVIEQPNSFRNGSVTRMLCGLYGIVRFMIMMRFGLEPVEANTKTVKKVVCDNGNADKEEMIVFVNRLYNLKLVFSKATKKGKPDKTKTDDDIADAIGVATYYIRTM